MGKPQTALFVSPEAGERIAEMIRMKDEEWSRLGFGACRTRGPYTGLPKNCVVHIDIPRLVHLVPMQLMTPLNSMKAPISLKHSGTIMESIVYVSFQHSRATWNPCYTLFRQRRRKLISGLCKQVICRVPSTLIASILVMALLTSSN